jgi:cobalamin 5''-phosphate synthase/cobalamin synthase
MTNRNFILSKFDIIKIYLSIMRDLLSFFTRIPMKGDIFKAAEQIYLLNLMAFLVSIIIFFIYELSKEYLPALFSSFITLLSIYSFFGLLHLDGLADFSDGMMKNGSTEEKIRALKDVNTGISGTFSSVMIILGLFIAIYSFHGNIIDSLGFFSISEISAKTSMITGIALFRSPEAGLAKIFKDSYKPWYLPVSIFSILPLFLIFHIYLFAIFIGILISLIVGKISMKNFGFVNGDTLGAMNEISRVLTMWSLCFIL